MHLCILKASIARRCRWCTWSNILGIGGVFRRSLKNSIICKAAVYYISSGTDGRLAGRILNTWKIKIRNSIGPCQPQFVADGPPKFTKSWHLPVLSRSWVKMHASGSTKFMVFFLLAQHANLSRINFCAISPRVFCTCKKMLQQTVRNANRLTHRWPDLFLNGLRFFWFYRKQFGRI